MELMKEKRIPTFLGLFLISLGLAITISLVQFQTRFLSRAEPSEQPKKILVSNIKPDQFSVSWFTDKEIEGFITYGENESLGNIALDKRDEISGTKGKFKTHYVMVLGLETGKTYYFKIGSGKTLYGGISSISTHCQDFLGGEPRGNSFKVSIPRRGDYSSTLRTIPISGLVASSETGENPISGAVVCVQLPEVLPLSDITGSSGNFVIPLTSVVKRDFSFLKNLPSETFEEIFVFGVNNEQSYAKLLSSLDHPAPILQLGKTYDFRTQIVLEPQNTPTPTPTPTIMVELTSPSEVISDTLPTFRGKGEPGQLLDIKVESPEEFTATIKVDQNGYWSWTPPANLPVGEHKVTITTRSDSGVLQKIVRNFTILSLNPILPVSAGSPSAQLSPTSTLTPSPFPTLIPTPTLQPSPTATPTPRELLETASEFPFLVFLTIGIVSITLGILMAF